MTKTYAVFEMLEMAYHEKIKMICICDNFKTLREAKEYLKNREYSDKGLPHTGEFIILPIYSK